MFSPERYVAAMRFAAAAHDGQKVPGEELPYLVHVVSVAAEVIAALPTLPEIDADLAVNSALLHDTLEDTSVTLDQLRATFGDAVAAGVSALTKNAALPKSEQMADSLRRILHADHNQLIEEQRKPFEHRRIERSDANPEVDLSVSHKPRDGNIGSVLNNYVHIRVTGCELANEIRQQMYGQ